MGAGLAGVAVAVGVGVAAGLAGVAVAVGVGVGAGLAGVAVAVAVGVAAGLAERAAGVTTFASAESCMLTDSPEPRKPVTRTATTTRTRAAHMSAPHLRRLPGLAGPAAASAAGSGAGALIWPALAAGDEFPPSLPAAARRVWRPMWNVTFPGPDRFRTQRPGIDSRQARYDGRLSGAHGLSQLGG